MSETGVQVFRMQPTFTVDMPWSAEEAIQRLRTSVRQTAFASHVATAGACVDFRIDPDQRRFWSPHLSVQISERDDEAMAFARYSPRPEIWTMFMAAYGVMCIVVFGAAIYGYVQWFMNESPWALILIPICLGVIVVLHIASLVGQNLSRDQMQTLRERLDEVVEGAKMVD